MSCLFRTIVLLLAIFLLTACGFHLRGAVQLPPELAEMALRDANPATDIAPDLRRALENEDIRINDTAPLVLALKKERYGKRVLSVGSTGRAQEYGLSYIISFSMRGADGVVWLEEQTITQTRDLRFDANAVLGTANEETQLKADMRRDAVLQILQRLQKAKPVVTPAAAK